VLRLLAFVLPLGADSFAVAAALGAAGIAGASERLRISVIFVAFEAGMPLIGLAAGDGLVRIVGSVADYVAAAADVIIAIAVVALIASQLGLALGHHISERFRERAEKLAAITLIFLAGYLIAEKILSG
jgi:putative Mn2+ efflux pump MntP